HFQKIPPVPLHEPFRRSGGLVRRSPASFQAFAFPLPRSRSTAPGPDHGPAEFPRLHRAEGFFKGLKAKGDDGFIRQVLVGRPGECQTLLPARGPTNDPRHHPCPGGAPVRDTGSEDGSGSSAAAPKATGQGGHRLPHWLKAAQRTGRAILGAHRAFSFPWDPRRLGLGRRPGSFWGLLKKERGKAGEGHSALPLAPKSPNAQVSNVTSATHRSNLSGFPRPCSVVLPGGP
uniref:uncharacterized protein LOC114677348 n=1 Tax=Macaca mulatta TaxID=9544 RepID=UPI0010A29083